MGEKPLNGIKKFKGNEYAIPIYTPRTTYNFIRQNDELLLNDLTLNFDPFTIRILMNEFRERNGEMIMTDFIMIIKDHLVRWQLEIPNREKKLIRCLSLLFDDIDLNGNNTMEWDEFTNYIIEKAAVLNTMKSKNEEIKTYCPCDFKIKKKFTDPISKVIYISQIQQIAFFEEEKNAIYFADPLTGKLSERVLIVGPQEGDNEEERDTDETGPPKCPVAKAALLDMIFIDDPRYNLLVTSSNDKIIRMFRYSANGFVPHGDSQRDNQIAYEDAQVIIVWDYINEILYSGERLGRIQVWNQKAEPQFKTLGNKGKNQAGSKNNKNERMFKAKKLPTFYKDRKDVPGTRKYDKDRNANKEFQNSKKMQEPQFHDDYITALLPLPKLQFLASASLDNNIILWDTIKEEKKRVYTRHKSSNKKGHKKGIMALDFNENLILLISAGFDHTIMVWNPYIEEPVFTLDGHNSPIISLKFVDNPLHIVSVDIQSVIKVWDVKKFKCIDSFMIDSSDDKQKNPVLKNSVDKYNPQGLCVLNKPLTLYIPGKNVVAFQYDRNNNLTSADEHMTLCAKFVPGSLSLLTPVGSKVKLWNLLTGEVKKIFSDLSQNEISCLILDNIGKRFILGDTDGFVGVYNVNNGALLKSLQKHNAEVISILHACSKKENQSAFAYNTEPPQYIITRSIDNTVCVHSDDDLNESTLLKAIEIKDPKHKDSVITYMTYEESIESIIVGANTGTISMWEVATGKNMALFKEEHEEITAVCFFSDLSAFIYGTSNGNFGLVVLPPSVVKLDQLWRGPNTDPGENQGICPHTIVYCKKNKKLFVADEKFWIKCYDVSEWIQHFEELDRSIKEEKQYKNTEYIKRTIALKRDWIVKAHDDVIRSMEYVPEEDLLITSCVDKKVNIFNSLNGEFIESLRQAKEGHQLVPIAYKKVESEEIYTPRMENRIDSEFMKIYRRRKKLEDERARQMEEGHFALDNIDYSSIKLKENEENTLGAFVEYEEQEFNPFYYTSGKIDPESIKHKKSNDWKLYINFEKYYKEFEQQNHKVLDEVKETEKKYWKMTQKETKLDPNKLDEWRSINNYEQFQEKINKKLDFKDKFKSTTAEDEREMKIKRLRQEQEKQDKMKLVAKKKGQIYSNIYMKQLKLSLKEQTNKVALSESEQLAAEKLSAALCNYNKNDPRNSKFLEYPRRKLTKKDQAELAKRKEKLPDLGQQSYNYQHEDPQIDKLTQMEYVDSQYLLKIQRRGMGQHQTMRGSRGGSNADEKNHFPPL